MQQSDQGLVGFPGTRRRGGCRLPGDVAGLQDWSGQPVPAGLQERLLQKFAIWEALHRQVRDAANEQERQLRDGKEPYLEKVRRLMGLKAVGVRSAWILVTELFAWRDIKNGKELGALVGLTPTPYDSGKSEREQGISKAGNKHVRGLIVELAWLWLRWQPGSTLSQWYQRRFGAGNKRARKVGIVALARKLLIALWRYVDQGKLPEGAAGEGLASAGGFDGAATRQGRGPRRSYKARTKGTEPQASRRREDAARVPPGWWVKRSRREPPLCRRVIL